MNKKLNIIMASVSAVALLCPFVVSGCAHTEPSTDGVAVVFDFNNGDEGNARPYTVYADENGKVDAPSAPQKTGYSFAYWSTDDEGKQKVDFPITVTENTRVYAQWTAGVYDVQFNLNYDATEPIYDAQRIEYKDFVSAPETEPERDGYLFRYWTNTPSSRIPIEFPYTVTRDIVFYASWRDADIRVYNVTLDYGDWDGAPDKRVLEVEQGEFVQSSQAQATRTGYTLVGWSEEPEGTNIVTFPYIPNKDMTLYAVWEEQKFSLNFNYNFADSPSTVYRTIKFTANSPINEPEAPTRAGYDFEGWYTSAKGGSKIEFPVSRTRNGSYYAHWISHSLTTDIFQAEYVEFDPTHKYIGYSGEAYGDQCIVPGSDQAGLSKDNYPTNSVRPTGNGYYISFQYSRDSVLTFKIYASQAITNAQFYINWSTEYGGEYGVFSDSAYMVEVNGNAVHYNTVTLTPSSSEGLAGTFVETLLGSVNLIAGENIITMYPSNDLHNGVLESAAPVIDYIKFSYSGSGLLSWRPVYDNLDNK